MPLICISVSCRRTFFENFVLFLRSCSFAPNMCCWCLRVYWTVLNNLFARFFNNLTNTFDNRQNCGSCCWCSCAKCKQMSHAGDRGSERLSEFEIVEASLGTLERTEVPVPCAVNHDYVIVDDIDANYIEIENRKIETEPYYRTIDRKKAEDILAGRENGACLVRPYKEADMSIKYIVSIYAEQKYFHLFIRQINGQELYGIGQAKPNERLFTTPIDIIEFYSFNALLCTNKLTSISLTLKPIVV